ncbi:MAG TPA: hypothetical protein VLZ81_08970 [Blastocatellia bacterium]|nr:hypothetical protein [Blastocatellia bacterium]
MVLEFHYHVVQLNRLNWRDFAKKASFVASALMAKMRIAPEDRPRVKLECLRMIARLKLNKAKMYSLFCGYYLRLNPEEQVAYEAEIEELAAPERATVMETALSWREQALLEGMEKGREEGREEGWNQARRHMASMLIHMTERQPGPLHAEVRGQIAALDFDHLEELGSCPAGLQRF